jgi:hypothetical protein
MYWKMLCSFVFVLSCLFVNHSMLISICMLISISSSIYVNFNTKCPFFCRISAQVNYFTLFCFLLVSLVILICCFAMNAELILVAL